MTDVPHVTDPQGGSPTLDDLADLHARTNRGLLALSRQVSALHTYIILGLGLLFLALSRLTALLRAIPEVS